jgi:hypothetical protein
VGYNFFLANSKFSSKFYCLSRSNRPSVKRKGPDAPERARRRHVPASVPGRQLSRPRVTPSAPLATSISRNRAPPPVFPPLSSPLREARRHAPTVAAAGARCGARREGEVNDAVDPSHYRCRHLLVSRRLPS